MSPDDYGPVDWDRLDGMCNRAIERHPDYRGLIDAHRVKGRPGHFFCQTPVEPGLYVLRVTFGNDETNNGEDGQTEQAD